MIITDRSVQYPRRYVLASTGAENTFDLTPVPGTVYQGGTPLNASTFDAVTESENSGFTVDDITLGA